MVSVMNELYCHKKSSPNLQMFYRFVDVLKDVVKNFANFTGKHLCRVKYDHKSLTLSMLFKCTYEKKYDEKQMIKTSIFKVFFFHVTLFLTGILYY